MHEKEIRICDEVFESRSDGIEMRAWQTLKTFVLAQLSHNSAMRKLPTFDEFLNWSGDPVMSHDLRDFYFFFTGNYPQ